MPELRLVKEQGYFPIDYFQNLLLSSETFVFDKPGRLCYAPSDSETVFFNVTSETPCGKNLEY